MTGKHVGKKYINTEDLTLSPNNVRKEVNEKALERLTTSVATFKGVLNPLIVNTKNEIIAGQRRWLSAKEAGIPKIFCTIKEYKDDYDEMMDSLTENDLHRDVSSREKGMIIIKMHDDGKRTFEEISIALGRPVSTVHSWYKEATGPEPLRPKDIKKALDKIKAKEKEVKDKKDKEKKEHPLLQEVVEKAEEDIKKEETRKKAKSIYDTFGLRTGNVVRRIVESPQFKDDIYKILSIIEFARDFIPLHDLEDMYKDIKKGLPVDLEFRKELWEKKAEYTFRTLRIRKTLLGKMRVIMKRRNIDWLVAIDEACRDWVKKWSLEEDWEYDRKKKDLKI